MFKKILDKINEKLSFLNLRQDEKHVEEQSEENVEEQSETENSEKKPEENSEKEQETQSETENSENDPETQSETENSEEKDKLDLVLNKDEIEYMSDIQRYENDGGKCTD